MSNNVKGTNNPVYQLLNEMSVSQLDDHIEKMKGKLINALKNNINNINPYLYQTFDTEQLQELIKKVSSNLINLTYEKESEDNIVETMNENNMVDDTSKNTIDLLNDKKTELLGLIKELASKKKSTSEEDSLCSDLDDDGIDIENIIRKKKPGMTKMAIAKEINSGKKRNLGAKQDLLLAEEDSSGNYDFDEMDLNTKVKRKNKSHKQKVKYHNLDIKSKEQTEPEYYNDYMIDLDKTLKNVVSFELVSYNLPNINNNVTNHNNELTVSIGKDEHHIELDEGHYSITNLTSYLQNCFDKIGISLQIKVNKSNNIIIKSKKDEEFKIIDGNNSIHALLGFTDNNLDENSTIHKSNDKHKVTDDTKIYLFVENVLNGKSFATIDLNEDPSKVCPIKLDLSDNPIPMLPDFVIKFKIDDNPVNDYL